MTNEIRPDHPTIKPRQVQNRLGPYEIDELVQAREAGATIRELAAQFRIHRTTVMKHLQRQDGS
jgi:predicted ArsR family transcriptional regulator